MNLFAQPSIVHSLVANLSPLDYASLYASVPALVRRPSAYPTPRAYTMVRLKRAIFNHLGPANQGVAELLWKALNPVRSRGNTLYVTGGMLLAILNGDPIDHATQDLDMLALDKDHVLALLVEMSKYNGELWVIEEAQYDNDCETITLTTETHTRLHFLIYANRDDMMNHWLHFDLSVCSNLANSAGVVQMLDPVGVRNRCCKVSMLHYVKRKLDICMSQTAIERNVQSVWDRILKYLARNYSVQFDVDITVEQMCNACAGEVQMLALKNIEPPNIELYAQATQRAKRETVQIWVNEWKRIFNTAVIS